MTHPWLKPGPPGPAGASGIPGPQGPQGADGTPTTVSDTASVNLILTGDDLSAEVIPGGISHGDLADLTTDDHTQYLLLAGRTGGQTVNGGDASGDILTLQGNSVNTNAIVAVAGRQTILNPSTGTSLAITPSHTAASILLDVNAAANSAEATANHIIIRSRAVTKLTGALRYTVLDHGGTTLKTGGGVPFVLFNVTPTFQFQAAQAAGQIFFFAPVFGDDGSARTIAANTRAIILQPNYSALTGGSTGAASTITGLEITPVVDSSWNALSTAKFIVFSNPTGTHATGITDLIGMDIPDSISKPTNVWSIRNVEDRARMHHRGSLNFGGGATPTQETVSLVALRDNALEHTSITFDEETTDPAQPAADAEARVYFKNGKLVVQWNLAGVTIYTTVPVNTAGPYPVNPVWTTDVVAP